MIDKRLGTQRVVIISLDSFYRALGSDDIDRAHRSEYNFGKILVSSTALGMKLSLIAADYSGTACLCSSLSLFPLSRSQ